MPLEPPYRARTWQSLHELIYKGSSLLILFGIIILFSISMVSAFQVKYYSSDINQTECRQIINSIPKEYFNGLRLISVMNILHPAFYGEYYPNLIHLTNGCYKDVLIHEMAHHLQFMRRDTWRQLIYHEGNFSVYQSEIEYASNPYYTHVLKGDT